jgi:hypothetical protein
MDFTRRALWGAAAGALLAAGPAGAVTTDAQDLALVAADNDARLERCDDAVASRDFISVFDCGDELFEVRGNAIDGVGINVGDGTRFARGPRADLTDTWNNNTPPRETGPNGEACILCHFDGADAGDGAGPAALQHVRDPNLTADPARFIQRQSPHIFGPAGPQLLAEEMTTDLQGIADAASSASCATGGQSVTQPLVTKGVSFGAITAACGSLDFSGVQGIDIDLVVKPFEWKGVERSLRTFSRGAFHQELGLQPVEITGDDLDGDFDGVVNEISIADVTAMAVYLAGQPRPTTRVELDELRQRLQRLGFRGRRLAEDLGLPELSREERRSIAAGEQVFAQIGCADCHVPALRTQGVIFSEPSQNPNYRDEIFPAGQNAAARGASPAAAVTFDITRDLPDNVIAIGRFVIERLGSFERAPGGGAIVRLFGDLKRHDMGPGLAEPIDTPPCRCGPSVFLTENLWGVGSTAPYMHDGRSTTLTEAILEHGGESAASRSNFLALDPDDRADLLASLNNLILFFPAEEE